MKKNIEPIKSQEEANEVKQYLVKTTSETLKISMEKAKFRVDALFLSGLLNEVSPLTMYGQMRIDRFMQISQPNEPD